MGIPSYFAFIIKNFPQIIKKYVTDSVDNLYIDSNSIVYDCVHSIEFTGNREEYEKQIIHRVCEVIDGYCLTIKPKYVLIALDGVAPVAKLNQQKTRRYKSWFTNEMEKQIKPSQPQDMKWNTTSITPGTIFMDNLNNYIHEYFISKNITKTKNIRFGFSGSDEPGEGEHKIFNKIRSEKEFHKNSNTIVYGLDADLIMLCLHHKHLCNTLNLYRETPQFIKQIDTTLNPNEVYTLDICLLTEKIIDTMTDTYNKNDNNLIHDYIFICFMLGNDFMPHHPAFNIRQNGIHVLLDKYKFLYSSKKNFCLTKDGGIVWNNVRKYITLLSEQEEELFQEEHNKKHKLEKRYLPNTTEDELWSKFQVIPSFERSTEHFINPNELGWQSRYYKMLFHINNDSDRIKNISFNYLEALEWTFSYYTTGCKDWHWKYDYNYAPLFKDLIKYIPFFETELIEMKEARPVESMVQLAYVIPTSSYDLLPKNVSTMLYDKFNVNGPYEMTWAYTKYFFESHVEFPELNIDTLTREISIL